MAGRRIHTHYDNLKVARNAPPEVIRAVYRTLAQKYHPDRNPNDPEAARIMTIVNAAYEVLSDPVKRKEHDAWIAAKEAELENGLKSQRVYTAQATSASSKSTGYPSATRATDSSYAFGFKAGKHFRKRWYVYLILGMIIWGSIENPNPKKAVRSPGQTAPTLPAPAPPQTTVRRPQVKPRYVRPLNADNGSPWPAKSGYVARYPRMFTDGLSSVMVDNTKNRSDVFVKLFSVDSSPATSVRVFFIRAGEQFAVGQVRSGNYDIRYRDLDSGLLLRSDAFELKETPTSEGIRYKRITMTLYKVPGGNMQTYPISEDEF